MKFDNWLNLIVSVALTLILAFQLYTASSAADQGNWRMFAKVSAQMLFSGIILTGQ
jgi:hypothetical protein